MRSGYAPEGIINNSKISYNDLIHPEDKQRVWDNVQAALSRRDHFIMEYRIGTACGKEKWVWEQGCGVFSEGEELLALEGFITDITERKQAENVIRLRTLVQTIPDLIWLKNADGVYLFCNIMFERFFGAKEADIVGKTDYDFVAGELADSFRENDRKAMAAGKPTSNEEWIVFADDGHRALLDTIKTPMFDAEGKLLGILGISHDIILRKRAEEVSKKLEERLQQSYKMEAIGTLAGGIAHDFNNILSGIMGYSELSLKAVRDRPHVYQNIEQVLKATERAKELVRQILTFSRKAVQEKKPTALSSLVNEVVKFMRASLPATIEIKQTIELTSDVIMADPTQLHQVLINLCTNAGHAMRETGGVLELGLEEAFIHGDDPLLRPSIKQGHYMVLTVRDTGHGILQENLERIFEPYFTTREKGEGTGLGLAVVDGIVKDHGGEIKVASEMGKGTIFSVYLPLMEKQTDGENEMEESLLPGKGETILFVDDETMMVNMSRELLDGLGYRVVTETDPVTAIEVFRKDSDAFDMVITDKTMPHLTGFDVAREVRQIRADIPVLICSGFQESGDVEKLTALGISQLITKPVRISILAKAIRDVLDKK